MHFNVNWIAVIVAAIAAFAVGSVWYMALSRQWVAASGRKPEDIDPRDVAPFIIGFVCLLVMAYFMGLVTPALFGPVTVWSGLLAGAHMWVGFVITTMILNHRYQGRPWALTLIDGGFLLLALLAQGIVFGLFGSSAPPAA